MCVALMLVVTMTDTVLWVPLHTSPSFTQVLSPPLRLRSPAFPAWFCEVSMNPRGFSEVPDTSSWPVPFLGLGLLPIIQLDHHGLDLQNGHVTGVEPLHPMLGLPPVTSQTFSGTISKPNPTHFLSVVPLFP